VTITWIPGEVVLGAPVDKWLLFCADVDASYPPPITIPEVDRQHTFSVPDGLIKCMMRSSTVNNLDSDDSEEITFLVVGGVKVDPRPNAPSLVIN